MFKPDPDRVRPTPAREPAAPSMPYDPEEWDRRLAEARTRREKVLRDRADAQSRKAAIAVDGRTDHALAAELRRLAESIESLKEPGARAELHASPAALRGAPVVRAPRVPRPRSRGKRAEPASRRGPGLRFTLAGLVAGCVAGAVLASLSGLGDGIADLGDRLMSRAPFGLSSPPEADVESASAAVPQDRPAGAEGAPSPTNAAPTNAAVTTPTVTPPAPADPVAEPVPTATPAMPAMPAPQSGARDAMRVSRAEPAAIPAPQTPAPASLGAPPSLATRSAGFGVLAPVAPVPEAIRGSSPRVTRVVVHAPKNIAPDRREAAAATLAEGKWPAERPVITPHSIATTQVRYYHQADRAAAEDLAALFDAETRDFTNFSPPPEEGLLELWLAGQGGRAAARPARTRAAAPRGPAPATDPVDRVVEDVRDWSYSGNAGPRREGSVRQEPPGSADGGTGPSSLGQIW